MWRLLANQTTLGKCSLFCSQKTYQDIEAVILEFISPYERSKEGIAFEVVLPIIFVLLFLRRDERYR